MRPARLHMLMGAAAYLFAVAPASGQDCKMLFCAPRLSIAPSFTVTNFIDAPRIRDLVAQGERELESDIQFAVVFLVDIPSTLPRIDFVGQLWWTPFAGTSVNPFTRYTAEEIDEDEVASNSPVLEFGPSVEIVRTSWFAIGLDVLSQFAPSSKPDAKRAYAHNLNLELGTTVAVFSWLPSESWFRHVKAYVELDYQATGLPSEGDEVPNGERIYLDDASPWQLWAGLKIPLAPIAPRTD